MLITLPVLGGTHTRYVRGTREDKIKSNAM
jgi:hypothetical protein